MNCTLEKPTLKIARWKNERDELYVGKTNVMDCTLEETQRDELHVGI